jgi:hypothetical protein
VSRGESMEGRLRPRVGVRMGIECDPLTLSMEKGGFKEYENESRRMETTTTGRGLSWGVQCHIYVGGSFNVSYLTRPEPEQQPPS